DGSSLDVNQIIWATGFVPAYEMIRIDGTIDKKGKPIHNRGISPIDGLYYIGLPWQHSRGSALIVVLEEMLCSWQIIFFDYSKRAPIWNKGVLVFCLQATINIKESSHQIKESLFICRTLLRNKLKRSWYLYE